MVATGKHWSGSISAVDSCQVITSRAGFSSVQDFGHSMSVQISSSILLRCSRGCHVLSSRTAFYGLDLRVKASVHGVATVATWRCRCCQCDWHNSVVSLQVWTEALSTRVVATTAATPISLCLVFRSHLFGGGIAWSRQVCGTGRHSSTDSSATRHNVMSVVATSRTCQWFVIDSDSESGRSCERDHVVVGAADVLQRFRPSATWICLGDSDLHQTGGVTVYGTLRLSATQRFWLAVSCFVFLCASALAAQHRGFGWQRAALFWWRSGWQRAALGFLCATASLGGSEL